VLLQASKIEMILVTERYQVHTQQSKKNCWHTC